MSRNLFLELLVDAGRQALKDQTARERRENKRLVKVSVGRHIQRIEWRWGDPLGWRLP